ncbi:MAG TPA: GGDEF domain-containing protein [Pseudolabrys sp.]|nr:GGDEF domain-containing protein [Pseudolabrys sp.]
MSLQGPMIVVADNPAASLVDALSGAGVFPIIETTWADAPTAFVAVKPSAVIIAEPGAAPSETAARMLCLQIATANGTIVPVIARVHGDQEAAIPIALPADAGLPVERLVARLQSAMRVRALHATVLRRIETFAAHDGRLPPLPVGDALDDATVLIAGRGPLYPKLSVAMGERFKMLGALSVETAAKHLNARDIDGIVVGDGFSPRMVEAFLTVLAQDTRFRDIPIAVIGEAPPDFAEVLPNIDHVDGDPARLVARMVPLVRMHAFEVRLKRMLKTLDTNGMFDPETGLFSRDTFGQELEQAVLEAGERSTALSLGRFSFDGPLDERASKDGARLVTRLIRNIDFGCRDSDGSLLMAFTQTDLRSAHVVARRIAGVIKNIMLMPQRAGDTVAANVTLATLKAGDTPDSLMRRVMGSQAVAAE